MYFVQVAAFQRPHLPQQCQQHMDIVCGVEFSGDGWHLATAGIRKQVCGGVLRLEYVCQLLSMSYLINATSNSNFQELLLASRWLGAECRHMVHPNGCPMSADPVVQPRQRPEL